MKRRILFSLASTTAALLLGGCASHDIASYANQRPTLDLQQYFSGTLDAYGVFTDRSGTVVKRFTVVMQCSWTGDDGVLDEDFLYSDGSRQKRVWRLKKTAAGRFIGRADDVVGEAVGESRGNAFHWTYTLNLPVGQESSDAGSVGANTIHVQFDDWMYLMTDKVMLNKAAMSKFGVHLGEVTLSFSKR
ncbi:MAG: DUF3833 domain-containing protein [Pseudomonadota bacterium]